MRKFDDGAIAALPPAVKPRDYYYDRSEPGLELAITPKGTKTFYFSAREFGRPIRIRMGRFPDLTVVEAQTLTGKMRRALREHRDPRDVLRGGLASGSTITLSEFWDIFLDRHVLPNLKNAKTVRQAFERYFNRLRGIPLQAITPSRVQSWHEQIGHTYGRPTADKQAGLLRSMFSKAMIWVDVDGRPYATLNPAAAPFVQRFGKNERQRFVTADELPRLFEALSGFLPVDAIHWILLALCTGARKTSLCRMRYADLDMNNGIWMIPAEDFKGGRTPHAVPLVSQAIHYISKRADFIGGDWVFPGKKNGQPLQYPMSWWRKIRAAAGIEDVTIHDLRRTTASWMAMTGASQPIIAQLLGHRLPGVTSIYARLAVEPVREALQVAVDRIWAVSQGDSDSPRAAWSPAHRQQENSHALNRD